VTRTARPATPADTEELVRLAAVMFNAMGLDASAPDWQEAGRQMTRRRLGSGDMAGFVVDGDEPGHLIAAGAVVVNDRLPGPRNPTGRAGYIQWVATEPGFRRQGLARQVMQCLLAWLAERHVTVVELHATADGEPLYRALGFTAPPNPQLVIRP
jgi:ribosomal protein S18 acetylase RimI-like enzyme